MKVPTQRNGHRRILVAVFLTGLLLNTTANADPNFGDMINAVKSIADQSQKNRKQNESTQQPQTVESAQPTPSDKAQQDAAAQQQQEKIEQLQREAEQARQETMRAQMEADQSRQEAAQAKQEAEQMKQQNNSQPAPTMTEPEVQQTNAVANQEQTTSLPAAVVTEQPVAPIVNDATAAPDAKPASSDLPFFDIRSHTNGTFADYLFWGYVIVSTMLGLTLLYRPLMSWYNRQFIFVRGHGMVEIFFKRIGLKLNFVLFILACSALLGCFGGNLYAIYRLKRPAKTEAKITL